MRKRGNRLNGTSFRRLKYFHFTEKIFTAPGLIGALILGMLAGYVLLTCAHRLPPPGGPEDKTPPQIVSTFPAPDSTHIRSLPHIEITFNEDIDPASLKGQIWLIPRQQKELKWKLKGKVLRISLPDSLLPDQTYILTLGTGIKDLRKNSLPAPFVLPFSTGAVIDRGQISGRVFGDNLKGIFIYAYPFQETLPDTLIFTTRPGYFSQVDDNGYYRLSYLKPGQYRLFALEDKNGDGLYTLQQDRIGIPFLDVQLDSARMSAREINFTMMKEDTTAPRFMGVDVKDARQVDLLFDEPLASGSRYRVSILDSVSRMPLKILGASLNPEKRSRLEIFTEPHSETIYQGFLTGITDTAGNAFQGDTLRFRYRGKTTVDTTSARLQKTYPADHQKGIFYDESIQLFLSHPVDSTSISPAVQILDSDSVALSGRWDFSFLKAPRFTPDSLLKKNATYSILVDLSQLKTIWQQSFGDSLYRSSFQSLDWAELGEISGVVRTNQPHWQQVILRVIPMRKGRVFTHIARVGSEYEIPFIPDGQYRLMAIMDVNQNGRYDRGKSLPFEFAEPILSYPDTVKVRKRWTTQGINLQFNY